MIMDAALLAHILGPWFAIVAIWAVYYLQLSTPARRGPLFFVVATAVILLLRPRAEFTTNVPST